MIPALHEDAAPPLGLLVADLTRRARGSMPGVSRETQETEPSVSLSRSVFGALLSKSLPEFRGYALSLARSDAAADDLLQEAALKAWQGREQFQNGSNFRAWFCRIVRNEAITAFRRRKPSADIGAVPEALLATNGGQEDRLEANDLLRILHELPTRHKEILTLVCGEDLTYDEAADAMDCSVASIKSRLWRARGEMQKRLFDKGQKLQRGKTTALPWNRGSRR